ncbi:MAG: hypothetical protein IPN15_11480 [Saprospiraceae bacterium]|nr:hypothetical protein [Candidatus Vicinibacter affinis]
MLKIIKSALPMTILVFCMVGMNPIIGQSSKNTKSSKSKSSKKGQEEYHLIDHLWFGGGFNLQFYQASIGNGVVGNVFELGLSPLVGYKLNSWISVGPRLEFSYAGGRFDAAPDVWKYNAFNFGLGAFNRLKFLKYLFSHIEYSQISQSEIVGLSPDNKLETRRLWNEHFYAGLGYNAGGIFSYELYLMYDFLAPKESVDLPIQFRIGLTYRF